VDVEDWFHILDLPSGPDFTEWDALPSRVETTFLRLLDLFGHCRVSVTCFFLGWVARKFPHLVTEAQKRGHEIASHGYWHRLAYQMSRQQFLEDVRAAKCVLEDTTGEAVLGFRCPGFSVTPGARWVFETLIEAGYLYDSSVFPARRLHGGLPGAALVPTLISTPSGKIAECPITVATLLNCRVCVFGGGYLRVAPLWAVLTLAERVLAERRPVVFYLHPRDIDANQPRLPMPARRRLRTYAGLKGTEHKLAAILTRFPFTTCASYLEHETLLRPCRS
jgi:polysaccharide deacetylase family protein (PEP-CTERM system associated)